MKNHCELALIDISRNRKIAEIFVKVAMIIMAMTAGYALMRPGSGVSKKCSEIALNSQESIMSANLSARFINPLLRLTLSKLALADE